MHLQISVVQTRSWPRARSFATHSDEQLCMLMVSVAGCVCADFPKAPAPALAAVLSPFAWIYGRPDLFDSYSAGVLLMQMVCATCRTGACSSPRLVGTEPAAATYLQDCMRFFKGVSRVKLGKRTQHLDCIAPPLSVDAARCV